MWNGKFEACTRLNSVPGERLMTIVSSWGLLMLAPGVFNIHGSTTLSSTWWRVFTPGGVWSDAHDRIQACCVTRGARPGRIWPSGTVRIALRKNPWAAGVPLEIMRDPTKRLVQWLVSLPLEMAPYKSYQDYPPYSTRLLCCFMNTMSKSLHKPSTQVCSNPDPLLPEDYVADGRLYWITTLETTNQGSKPQSLCTTWSWALSSSGPQYLAPTGEKVSGTLGAGRHAHGRRCIPGLMLSLAQLTSGLRPLESSRLLPGTLRIAHLQISAHLRNPWGRCGMTSR